LREERLATLYRRFVVHFVSFNIVSLYSSVVCLISELIRTFFLLLVDFLLGFGPCGTCI